LQIKSIRDSIPISTRAASIFIPACIFPAATIAGVTGSEALMDATSNAGATAVCPNKAPAAKAMQTPIAGRNLFGILNDTFSLLDFG
jgi:hypothetical protein